MLYLAKNIEDLSDFKKHEIYDYIDIHTSTILHGKDDPTVSSSKDVIVLCIMKNAEFYMNSFLDYYLNTLKVKHIYFLDNGSTDNTIPIIRDHSQGKVTVLQTLLPFKIFRKHFREYLLDKFGKNKWCLVLDIDEFFDFPFAHVVGLNGLIAYLSKNNYTTVVTQMLDMFPKGDILNIKDEEYSSFLNSHRYYDISSIRKERYWNKRLNNTIENRAIRLHFGGIRKKTFDLDSVLLSKHTLIYYTDKMEYAHIHWVKNAKVADISAVIFHYKFHDKFLEHVKEAVKQEHYHDGSKEYKSYLNKINKEGILQLDNDKSHFYTKVEDLIFNYFLFLSPKYLNYCYSKINSDLDYYILLIDCYKFMVKNLIKEKELKEGEINKLKAFKNGQ